MASWMLARIIASRSLVSDMTQLSWNLASKKPILKGLLLSLSLPGGRYGVIIRLLLKVFYACGKFFKIGSSLRFDFFSGALSLLLVVFFVSMG